MNKLAARRDQELGIFLGLRPRLQKRVEFPLLSCYAL